MKKHYLLSFSGFLLAISALSAASIYDGFSSSVYSSGQTINGLAGGDGWSNNWTVNTSNANNPLRYESSTMSLGYSDGTNSLFTTAGSLKLVPSGAGAGEVTRTFSESLTGEVWFSFLNIRTSTGSWNWEFAFADESGTTQFSIQNNSNTGKFRVLAVAASEINLTNYDLGENPEAQLFVGQITNVGSGLGNSSITIWANPNNLLDLGDGAAATASLTNRTIGALDQFIFNKGAGVDQTGYFDELRFGSSAADVLPTIPEPSTYALFASMLAFAFIWNHKRRKR